MKHIDYLRLAGRVARQGSSFRAYRLGAIGIRSDGALVTSTNGCAENKFPKAHAEARLVRKLDYGSVVYVARIKRDNILANSRPCVNCMLAMKHRGIKRCYYSITEKEYGVLCLD